jgi:hypothetical protein
MKQILPPALRSALCLGVFQLGLLLGPTLAAAVTFTVTPAAVSNTYNGFITLQVTGLTNAEVVVVHKSLDVNTNGVVDAGDWLVQQFKLTDGQAGMVIGGINNSNVPGDTDTTAGQITAVVSFRNGDFIQNTAGQYAFQLFSPGGHFAPLTTLFSVTNVPYPQQVTGNVVSNGTSTTLPNAVVLLFPPPAPGKNEPKGHPLAGAVANNAGSYTIPAPAGTYMAVAFQPNYLASFATAPVLTLGSGATIITNLTLTNATASLSGQLVDANNLGKGLPGLFMSFKASSGLLGVGFSDTNGNFNLGVQAGQWGLEVDDTSLIVHGFVGLQDRTNVNAGQTGIILAFPKATALFYGSVKDSLGNPMPGIDVYAQDNNNFYQNDGYSDANGNYAVGAIGGLSNDPWWIQTSNDSNPSNYIFTQPSFASNGGTNLNNNGVVQFNFTGLLATNLISGWLKDGSGNPITGVGVSANATINGVDYNEGSVDTDATGNYSLNVANGMWNVSVNSCGDCGDGLPGSYLSPANRSLVISNNNGTANFTALLANNHISGHVQQSNGTPIGNVGVWASATLNSADYFQYVDADGSGNYSLNVANGTWTVGLESNGGNDSLNSILGGGTYQNPANQIVSVNNNDPVVNFSVAPPAPLQMMTNSLPGGTVGVYYQQSLSASGGQAPYNWWLPGGTSTLPPGNFGDMNFSSNGTNGTISGTPGSAGTFPFWVGVSDNAFPQNVVTQMFSITITIGSTPLQVVTGGLPGATQNAPYSTALAANGGQPPYRWSLAPGSANPPYYVALSTNGLLSGTPVSSGTDYFIVRVTDSISATADRLLGLVVTASTNKPVLLLTQPTRFANGQFQFTFNTAPDTSYTLQVSSDLRNWSPVSLLSGSGGPLTVSDLTASDTRRFYRILIGP